MLETILLSSLITLGTAVSLKIPKKKMKDKAKINHLFRIAKVATPDKNNKPNFPKFKSEKDNGDYISYHYTLPMGIRSKVIMEFQEHLTEGLGKPVDMKFNEYVLEIKVYKNELPWNVPFEYPMCKMGTWEVAVGQSLDGIVYHDFDKSPNILIGGLPNYGKSQLEHLICTQLLVQQPDNVKFYIIDLKGKMEFQDYEMIKQVKGVAGNIFESLVLLDEMVEDLNNQIEKLRSKHIRNIVDSDIKERTFLIIDEISDLAPGGMNKEVKAMCIELISQIARKGRACGFRSVIATQYPLAKVIDSTIKAVCDCKIGFRLTSKVESSVVIDQPGLEELPFIERLPNGKRKGQGRIIRKTDKLEMLQVPLVRDETLMEVLKYNENPTGKPNRINLDRLKKFEAPNDKPNTKNRKGPKGKKKYATGPQNNGGRRVSFGSEVRK